MFKLSNLQKVILIATAGLLFFVSLDDNSYHNVHLAKIAGIVSASIFLTYGVGQLKLTRPSYATYQNIKKLLYCGLLIVTGFTVIIAGIYVAETYKAKTSFIKYLENESRKTPAQIEQEKRTLREQSGPWWRE